MRTVALATCRELPHLDADEVHLVRALEQRGVTPVVAPWDGGDAAFLACPLTVIRSTWDYTSRVDEFVAWAARIEAQSRIHNKASVVRWNTHKKYLLELEEEGVKIVPTVIAKAGAVDVERVLIDRGWTRGAVVKPCVSAGSKDTVRVPPLDPRESISPSDATAEVRALLCAQPAAREMMIQPYVDGVADGELSLIYIGGAFSHAVNKRPKPADFRSQPEFGSSVDAAAPTKAQRAAADDVLAIVGGDLLYARVDVVRGDDGAPWLMELELVEPCLYLAYDDKAGARLADAIVKKLDRLEEGKP